jgi:hypothetical protein
MRFLFAYLAFLVLAVVVMITEKARPAIRYPLSASRFSDSH